jgi:deazaflavin-dependent oxidoreductase (nitroreductase family)
MILVHHIGARSGTERVTPLVTFPQDDGRYVIIASKAGAPTNPDWYHNLRRTRRSRWRWAPRRSPVEAVELEGA